MNDDHTDGQPTAHGRRPTVTVAEAAKILGVSVDSVRSRLHRGTLEGFKVQGTWRVILPDDVSLETDSSDDRQSSTGNLTASDGERQSADEAIDNALVEQLRSENARLWERLEEADRQRENVMRQMADERERFDVIHRAALGRIEALTATVGDGQEQRGSTEHDSEAVESTETNETSSLGVIAWLRRLLSS